MIHDSAHNYLFVHVQKTGGTSVTEALARMPTARFVSPSHLRLRAVETIDRRPFVFAAVRNPWERLVSWYLMMRRKGIHNHFSSYLLEPTPGRQVVSFSEFIRRNAIVVERTLPESLWPDVEGLVFDRSEGYLKSVAFNQFDYLTNARGEYSCDRVLRLESLEEDLRVVLSMFHSDLSWLRIRQANANPEPIEWREYYANAEDRAWVARLYAKDIAHFGFSYS